MKTQSDVNKDTFTKEYLPSLMKHGNKEFAVKIAHKLSDLSIDSGENAASAQAERNFSSSSSPDIVKSASSCSSASKLLSTSVMSDEGPQFPLLMKGGASMYLDLNIFKIKQCKTAASRAHNPKRCLNFHNIKQDKRRVPGNYTADMCPYIQQKMDCPYGDGCTKCHTMVEEFYHPHKYKTKFCSAYMQNPDNCKYGEYCCFAHSETEICVDLIHKMDLKDDDFYIHHFKTVFCPRTDKHERDGCVYAHNWQDYRRKPQLYNFEKERCPNWDSREFISDYDKGCSNGVWCKYSHGWKEQEYHPNNYKMNSCKQEERCEKMHCPYFHSEADKRKNIPEGFRIIPNNRNTAYQASTLQSSSKFTPLVESSPILFTNKMSSNFPMSQLSAPHFSPPKQVQYYQADPNQAYFYQMASMHKHTPNNNGLRSYAPTLYTSPTIQNPMQGGNVDKMAMFKFFQQQEMNNQNEALPKSGSFDLPNTLQTIQEVQSFHAQQQLPIKSFNSMPCFNRDAPSSFIGQMDYNPHQMSPEMKKIIEQQASVVVQRKNSFGLAKDSKFFPTGLSNSTNNIKDQFVNSAMTSQPPYINGNKFNFAISQSSTSYSLNSIAQAMMPEHEHKAKMVNKFQLGGQYETKVSASDLQTYGDGRKESLEVGSYSPYLNNSSFIRDIEDEGLSEDELILIGKRNDINNLCIEEQNKIIRTIVDNAFDE